MDEEILLQLSPPQYTYFNYIKYSIGDTPCVDVLEIEEVEEGYVIPIVVTNRDKARELATILILHKIIGNINIYIRVIYNNEVVEPLEGFETIEDLVEIYEQALCSNCYFVEVIAQEILPGNFSIFPVFTKEIIQFFNDDLSDLYRNFNGVAAAVFREVLRPSVEGYLINPSTTENC